ncbi:MAG: cell division protein FtsZ [Bacteroidota bacterium]
MAEELIKFDLPEDRASIIKVIGIGGGGGNAVNHMLDQGIKDVNFVVCNTDAQALSNSQVSVKIQLGESLTEGRGAGNKPETGKQAAIENMDDVMDILSSNTKMVFLTAGMGGGTGTGAIPVIAKAAQEQGILTVAIVTLPFRYEGPKRINQAIEGIHELGQHVDSLLVINNEKLREVCGNMKLSEAFSHADNVLATAAKGIAEIITVSGYINVDFADVETVLTNSGVAIMGTGTAEGENRAIKAIEQALTSPLLNDNDLRGTENILLNITSGTEEITMDEISEIMDYIYNEVETSPNIIWGTGHEEGLENAISVTIVATGFENSSIPELYAKKSHKKKITLNDNSQSRQETPAQSNRNSYQHKEQYESQQRTMNFDIKQDRNEDEFVVKNKKNSEDFSDDDHNTMEQEDVMERIKENREHKQDAPGEDMQNDKDIESMENVPAYKRKKIKIDHPKHSKESKISKYTLSDDDEEKTRLKENNSYLHDNVD